MVIFSGGLSLDAIFSGAFTQNALGVFEAGNQNSHGPDVKDQS
jgi:hypothetical protein